MLALLRPGRRRAPGRSVWCTVAGFADWLAVGRRAGRAPGSTRTGFKAKPGAVALLPGAGRLAAVLRRRRPGRALGCGQRSQAPCRPATGGWTTRTACCRRTTPRSAGRWPPTASPATAATRPSSRGWCCPRGLASRGRCALAEATWQARDLINTPANDLGPERAGRRPWSRSPSRFGAECQVTVGEELLAANYPADPCRRPRQRPRTAPDRPALGRSGGTQGDAGRQGRVLRHRRARHQAVEQHAADEEGHGRRRDHAGAGPLRHGAGPAGAPAPADPGGREQHRRHAPSGPATS